MEETLVHHRSQVPQTKFEEDIQELLVEQEFHSMWDAGNGELVCYYGDRFKITNFLPNTDVVIRWKDLQDRYAAGER